MSATCTQPGRISVTAAIPKATRAPGQLMGLESCKVAVSDWLGQTAKAALTPLYVPPHPYLLSSQHCQTSWVCPTHHGIPGRDAAPAQAGHRTGSPGPRLDTAREAKRCKAMLAGRCPQPQRWDPAGHCPLSPAPGYAAGRHCGLSTHTLTVSRPSALTSPWALTWCDSTNPWWSPALLSRPAQQFCPSS